MGRTYEEIYNSLPGEEQKTLDSYFDAKANRAIASHIKKNPAAEKVGDVDAFLQNIARRLAQLERWHSEKAVTDNLKIFAMKKCFENHVAYAYEVLEKEIPATLDDEISIENRISELAHREKKKQQKNKFVDDLERSMH